MVCKDTSASWGRRMVRRCIHTSSSMCNDVVILLITTIWHCFKKVKILQMNLPVNRACPWISLAAEHFSANLPENLNYLSPYVHLLRPLHTSLCRLTIKARRYSRRVPFTQSHLVPLPGLVPPSGSVLYLKIMCVQLLLSSLVTYPILYG